MGPPYTLCVYLRSSERSEQTMNQLQSLDSMKGNRNKFY
jgi:hypothetical protein